MEECLLEKTTKSFFGHIKNTHIWIKKEKITKNQLWGNEKMIISTSPNIEGKRIVQYLGLVVGTPIIRADDAKSLLNKEHNIHAQFEFERAKIRAINEMITEAKKLNAGAIISSGIDFKSVDSSIIVIAIGTAVLI